MRVPLPFCRGRQLSARLAANRYKRNKESSMANQIKVGVVGCGYWGPNLIRNFRTLVDCNLKIMCDVSEKRLTHLRSVYPEVEGSADYSHMLNGIGLDA